MIYKAFTKLLLNIRLALFPLLFMNVKGLVRGMVDKETGIGNVRG